MPDKFSSRQQKILVVIGNGTTVAADFPALSNLVPGAQVINLAAGLTANTRFSVAHGLGYRPALHCVRAWWVGADSDAAAPIALGITKTDATSIFLKPSATQATAAQIALIILIDLEADIGGRYPFNQ